LKSFVIKNNIDPLRAFRIITRVIESLNLNLKGKTILTEVGSNNYIYTPIIAAIAGATKVIAWAKDSRYGQADQIIQECTLLARQLNVSNAISFRANIQPIEDIEMADVITNSGALRPIDVDFISHMKQVAVLPLMFEAWELREEDIDIKACKDKGIKVAGTWESHPEIKVFDYTGLLAVKLLLNAGVEIYDSNIVIWSNDHFGEIAEKALKNLGAKNVWVTTKTDELYSLLPQLDAIYICNYSEERHFFGESGIFDLEHMISKNNAFTLVHLYGNINAKFCKDNGLKLYPERDGKAKMMTETLGYVGLEPLLRLQVAGFKVAECLMNNIENSLVQLM
jgi:hypothetical protein